MKSFSIKSHRTFSEKSFSKITNEDEFREYAHNVMKEAHGDEYSEEVTNKVVDDLIKNNPDADYGELIGRLTSGFGDKTMSTRVNRTFSISEEVFLVYQDDEGEWHLKEISRDSVPYCKKQYGSETYVFVDESDAKEFRNAGNKIESASSMKEAEQAHVIWNELRSKSFSELGDKSFADTEVGTVTIKTSNPKRLGELIQMIKDHGNPGHSFDCIIDKDDENQESWSWDGDGSDRISDIEIIDVVKESRTFSIAEDREFAHGRGYKARQLEIKRLQDLYDDVKSKQKGDDPSQRLRNRMLLQEIKVQLEEARYDFYKHAYEESKL